MAVVHGAGLDDASEATPEDALEAALAELAGLLLAEEGLDATLQRVADLALRVVPGCSAAGVTLLDAGRWSTAAYTASWLLEVDRGQYDAGDGPCLTAIRQRRVVHAPLAELQAQWPAFVAAALAQGVGSVLAAPLQPGDGIIGGLNLYSSSPDGFSSLDENLMALFTGQASVSLANAAVYRSALRLTGQLQEALASRAVIEQAKGALMVTRGLDEDAAFAVLREDSQRTNRKLRDVARAVLAPA